jgi:hypothetical protein
LMIHHVPCVGMGCFGYGSKFPSTVGIFGGYAVPPVFIQTVSESNMKSLMAEGVPSLQVNFDQLYEAKNPEEGNRRFNHVTMRIQPLMNGDTFYVPVGGGAGYGDALERNPEAVMEDLRNGLTTHWAAGNIYKVAYDQQTLRLYPEKTEELRNEALAERKQKGTSYAEFEKEWLKLRPSDQAIKYYGAYPNPGEEIENNPPGTKPQVGTDKEGNQ